MGLLAARSFEIPLTRERGVVVGQGVRRVGQGFSRLTRRTVDVEHCETGRVAPRRQGLGLSRDGKPSVSDRTIAGKDDGQAPEPRTPSDPS